MKALSIILLLLISLGPLNTYANDQADLSKLICEMIDCDQEVDDKPLSEGVVGATCSSSPQVFATVNGRRKRVPCFSTDESFYPGALMAVAKKAAIRRCKQANALDPSGDYPDAKESCYDRCEVDTHCLYGDNR